MMKRLTLILAAIAVMVAAGIGIALWATDRQGSITAMAEVAPSQTEGSFLVALTRASPEKDIEPITSDPVTAGEAAGFTDIEAGEYRIEVSDPGPEVDLTGVSCQPESAVASVDLNDGVAVLDVAEGQDVTCSFTHTQRGRIVVTSTSDPSDAARRFAVTPSWAEPFRLTDGERVESEPLPPGEYALTRTLPAGWSASATKCDDGSDLSAIMLDPGETVTCDLAQRKKGSIVVVGRSRPEKATPAYRVTPSWGDAFDVVAGEEVKSPRLLPGEYSIAPSVPAGWDLTKVRCTGGADPSNVTVEPGETVRCTITATQRGRIVLNTLAEPSGAEQTFRLDPSWRNVLKPVAGASKRSGPLIPGEYSVQNKVPAGWVRTAAECDDGSRPSRIDLDAGETVTCSFSYLKKGQIVVAVEPAEGADTAFAFKPSWGKPFELGQGETQPSRRLPPGEYSLDGVTPIGWQPESASCDDGSDPSAIELGVGETVTCTFSYQRPVFTVATFNVLGNSHTDKGGHAARLPSGATRMGWTVDLIRSWGVDIIGMQEFQRPQMDAFVRLAGGEFTLYPSPGMAQRNKQNAIAWRTSEFELVRGRPVMIPYFNGNKVPMPLVLLRHRESGQQVYVMTVHNAASVKRVGNQARWRNAAMNQQIALTSDLLGEGIPLLMTGDMNERTKYFCSYTASGTMHAAAGGSRGGRCQPPPSSIARVDWIFGSSSVQFSDYHFIKDGLVRKTSDHPFIVTDVRISN